MNLLKDGMKNGKVVITPLAKKLTIDGETKAYQVYKIDLDLLFYNDQNDRIATWLSQYKDTYGNDYLKTQTREEYNNIITAIPNFSKLKESNRIKQSAYSGEIEMNVASLRCRNCRFRKK